MVFSYSTHQKATKKIILFPPAPALELLLNSTQVCNFTDNYQNSKNFRSSLSMVSVDAYSCNTSLFIPTKDKKSCEF